MVDRSGRNATPRTNYGRRSILYAVCALVLVVGMFAAYGLISETTLDAWREITGTAGAVAFLLVAPVLHVIGLIYGLRGLLAPNDGRVASGVGILLNFGLVALGAYLIWLILPAATAFR